MTKTKVTEKLRSGRLGALEARPDDDAEQADADRPREHLGDRVDHAAARASRGPDASSSARTATLCQASDSPTKETIRTSDAAQANSQAGIGRSWRPTSAWPTTRMPCGLDHEGFTVISASWDDAVLELDLEHPVDRRRDVELDLAAGLDVLADVIAVEVDLVGDVGVDHEA